MTHVCGIKILGDAAPALVAERLSPFIGEEDRRDTDVGVGGCLLRSPLSTYLIFTLFY